MLRVSSGEGARRRRGDRPGCAAVGCPAAARPRRDAASGRSRAGPGRRSLAGLPAKAFRASASSTSGSRVPARQPLEEGDGPRRRSEARARRRPRRSPEARRSPAPRRPPRSLRRTSGSGSVIASGIAGHEERRERLRAEDRHEPGPGPQRSARGEDRGARLPARAGDDRQPAEVALVRFERTRRQPRRHVRRFREPETRGRAPRASRAGYRCPRRPAARTLRSPAAECGRASARRRRPSARRARPAPGSRRRPRRGPRGRPPRRSRGRSRSGRRRPGSPRRQAAGSGPCRRGRRRRRRRRRARPRAGVATSRSAERRRRDSDRTRAAQVLGGIAAVGVRVSEREHRDARRPRTRAGGPRPGRPPRCSPDRTRRRRASSRDGGRGAPRRAPRPRSP